MPSLLTRSNPKIAKDAGSGYLTAILHLAPSDLSGYQTCSSATAGCRAGCLNTSGQGGINAGSLDSIRAGESRNHCQRARIARTRYLFQDRAGFMADLARDIRNHERNAKRHGLQPVVRLNGTSDLPWERMRCGDHASIMHAFPGVIFYDYTKHTNRRNLPANYSLTFSRAESNDTQAAVAIRNGLNVAVVFDTAKGEPLPLFHAVGGERFPVLDGDTDDLRFRDPAGHIVGLRAKGRARKDATGFVVKVAA